MFAIKRRKFLTLFGGAVLAWPLAVRAQPMAKVWHVGMLETTAATLNATNLDAFKQALRQLGYIEGQNLIVEYRSGDGHIERFPQLAAELVRLNVDIIITRGTPAALAAKKATATIPIVMAAIGEPVETGMVASLARPGGNVTGLSAFVTELTAKRIEIMREVIPQLSRMALIDNMANRSVPAQWDETKRAAFALGIQPQLYDVRKAEDIERAFSSAIAQRVNALSVGNDSVVIANRIQVVQLAAKHRLPAIYATRDFVDAGGLLSYAAHYPDLYRRAAAYVDKIFKGAKPADLPVEQPTKFEIVVNLKAASALGLTVPSTLLARADEVIE
ncbi:MAG TPA: ABC transporter substrate-binding protein [Bradyrhizobium sp.]|jgi:putative ABC transport system substrate-binding protein|nr:ABC transporter substrate-binding protein [Bradyrhizobium sp.]